MGFFDSIVSGIQSVAKVVAPVAKAAASFLPIPPIAKTALDMGIDALAGTSGGGFSLPNIASLVPGGGDIAKMFMGGNQVGHLYDAQKGASMALIQRDAIIAGNVRGQREALEASIAKSIGDATAKDLVYSDDMVFSAITKVTTQTKVPKWGVPLARDSTAVAGYAAALTTPLLGTSFPNSVSYGTTTTGLASVGPISDWVQSLMRAYFNSKSILELQPVLQVITRLNDLGIALDNPYDFYNILGYNGPEVVAPIAKMDVPIVNGMLRKVALHRTTKSLNQWFAAVAYYRDSLGVYRKIVADWLGNQVNTMPAFFIDMLTFYIFVQWGKDMQDWLYNQYATKEMVNSMSVASFTSQNIYDKYDKLHYMLGSANVGWELTYAATPATGATEAQSVAYMLASYQLVVVTFFVLISKQIMNCSSFGIDSGDITDLQKSLTGLSNSDPQDYWEPLALLCNKDNADILLMGADDVASMIAQASIAASDIVLLDEGDLISVTKVESLVRQIETSAQQSGMTQVSALELQRLADSVVSNIEYAVSKNKLDAPERAGVLTARLKTAIIVARSNIAGGA